jgi:hypothetical protein
MKNPIAELYQYNSFQFVKPQDAAEGKSFYCPDPECPDPERKLFLRKSSLDKKYFTHKIGKEHEIHPKTLLHKMVVGEFKKLKTYRLPKIMNGRKEIDIDHHKSTIEFKGLSGDTPDIHLVAKDGFECFVEVAIGFKPNKKKVEEAKKRRLPLIEVNIEKFYSHHKDSLSTDINFFINHAPRLVDGPSSKIVYDPWETKTEAKKHVSTTTMIGGAVLLGAAGLATYFGLKK